MFSKKNALHPFEDPHPLEFYSERNQAAFIVLASHSKKRPHSLVFARMYDGQLLDMIEVGLESIRLMEQFEVNLYKINIFRDKIIFKANFYNRQSKQEWDKNHS
jgi:ribosome production factor 2